MSVNEKMTAIADNIRDKTGGTEALTLDDMAGGVNEVYEAGKKSEYDEFWEVIQANGTRKNYEYAFARWNSEYIRPKYKVINTARAMAMFYHNKSLKIIEKQYFDVSKAATNATQSNNGNYQTFAYCDNLEMIEDIGMKAGYYHDTFRNCYKLHTIEVVRVTEECIFSNTCFYDDRLLKNIVIDGTIGTSIRFQSSPLSVESMKSIISHLKDYKGTDKEFTYTITFSSACITALEAEGATAEYTDSEGNTTLVTWRELINLKKWNLG